MQPISCFNIHWRKLGGWVSPPCRAACLSKAAVQRELSPPTPELRLGADCDDLQAVPMQPGGEGSTALNPPSDQSWPFRISIYDIAGRALRDVGGEDLPVWAEPLQQEPERLDAAPGLLQRDDVQPGDDFGDARHGMSVPFGESLGRQPNLFVRLPNARTFQMATNSLVSPLAGIVLSSAPESLSKSCVTACGG
jgi:hypothetical protein